MPSQPISPISPLPPGTALITGASSGIGEGFARRLAWEGYDLIVVARRRERLEALARRMRAQHGVDVEVLAADLLQPDGLQAVEDLITAEPFLTLLVNNAGVDGDPEPTIRLHVDALTRLTHAALPGMVERGAGAVINVASIAAFRTVKNAGLPYMTTYAATKAFDVTFCLRLHDELRGTGVQVQALCPGWTVTEMAGPDNEELQGVVPAEAWMSADDVVQASLAGLALGEVVCLPSLEQANLLDELERLKNAILARAGTSGVLASRYREGAPADAAEGTAKPAPAAAPRRGPDR
jgi:short-subunit dehydrogenase